MAALQYVDVPGYAALLLRRSYADLSLPGAIMDRGNHWLRPTDAHWSEIDKTWRFASGATLTFGYLQHENDKYRYQGAEFQFVGFDELSQFSETQYRYLFSRLRRLEGVRIPIRMRSASNPGGVGHDWVKTRFIDDPGRVFIPARLSDNPHVDQDAYVASLDNLDPVTRQRLLLGDWEAREPGGYFNRAWFDMAESAPTHSGVKRVRFWDMASTEATSANPDPDWTVGLRLAVEPNGLFWVEHMVRVRARPAETETLVRHTAEADGMAVAVRMEEEPGSSGKSVIDHYRRQVMQGYDFRGIRSTGDKETRAGPVSARAEAREIKLVRGPWNLPFLDEVESFPEGSHDDVVDALSGAYHALFKHEGGQGSYMPQASVPVVRRGDLVLRGERYIDKT